MDEQTHAAIAANLTTLQNDVLKYIHDNNDVLVTSDMIAAHLDVPVDHIEIALIVLETIGLIHSGK